MTRQLDALNPVNPEQLPIHVFTARADARRLECAQKLISIGTDAVGVRFDHSKAWIIPNMDDPTVSNGIDKDLMESASYKSRHSFTFQGLARN